MRSAFLGIRFPWSQPSPVTKKHEGIIEDFYRAVASWQDAWAAFNEADDDSIDTAILRVALAERELGATLKQARDSGVVAPPTLIEGDELGLWPF
jgi:hypothetical protein